ncbi:MAG: DUF2764 domain-containing protein [Candidatus Cloacimonetes bacterium]|jgi:hypothetical protein|nr:DUF2764 domain-containing protein [Candidatus Cloacimonadota bacterium]NLO43873.1 DUF2764 family protein [Candidatus Cloacimonadota bacterium]
MAKEYYYLIAGLPNISLDDTKIAVRPEQFRPELKEHLSAKDYSNLELLHLPSDIQNLLYVLYKEDKRDSEGIYSHEYWQGFIDYLRDKLDSSNLACPDDYKTLPEFVGATMLRALQLEELPNKESLNQELLSLFFNFVAKHKNPFIKAWFELDRNIRNILSAVNGRNHKIPYAQYLIGDDDVTFQLSSSHAADFGLGKELPIFDSIMRIWEQNDILHRERGYDVYKGKWIDEQNFFEYFTIDRILGYYSKLRIIDRWIRADAELGRQVFQDTIDRLEHSFSFPEDFNIKIKQK